jgi:hypothetical protein
MLVTYQAENKINKLTGRKCQLDLRLLPLGSSGILETPVSEGIDEWYEQAIIGSNFI